jgi:ubiquinone/menaquinone biosynthesis C-methylase UbiE
MRSVAPDVYSVDYFLNQCEGNQDFQKSSISKRLEFAINLLPIKKGEMILDIGSGRGEMAHQLSKYGTEVYAIDYSINAIIIATERFGSEDRLHFIQMDAKNLEFQDKYFDKIFMIDIVEHLNPEELKMVLSEAKRVLKDNGALVIHTAPNLYLTWWVRLVSKIIKKEWKSTIYHINEMTPFQIKKILHEENFYLNIFITRSNNFYSNQVEGQNSFIKIISKFLDFLLENPISNFLFEHSFIRYIIGTDIYAIAHKKGVCV